MKMGTDSPLWQRLAGRVEWPDPEEAPQGCALQQLRRRRSKRSSRAILGRQALVCAYAGEGSDSKYQFWEDTEDRGNIYVAGFESIFGVKKTQFTIDGVARDFSVIAVDTYIPASI